MYAKYEAYHKIEDFVTRFGEQIASYKKSDYNETLVHRDFIDPFFKTFGWNVDNPKIQQKGKVQPMLSVRCFVICDKLRRVRKCV